MFPHISPSPASLPHCLCYCVSVREGGTKARIDRFIIALFQNHVTFFFCRGLKVAWARIGRTNFKMAASV